MAFNLDLWEAWQKVRTAEGFEVDRDFFTCWDIHVEQLDPRNKHVLKVLSAVALEMNNPCIPNHPEKYADFCELSKDDYEDSYCWLEGAYITFVGNWLFLRFVGFNLLSMSKDKIGAKQFALIADAPDLIQQAVEVWNEAAEKEGLSRVRMPISISRKKKLKARLKYLAQQDQYRNGLEGWKHVVAKITDSYFLTGQNKAGWKATFDFVLQPATIDKILEDNYGPRKSEGAMPTNSAAINAIREI